MIFHAELARNDMKAGYLSAALISMTALAAGPALAAGTGGAQPQAGSAMEAPAMQSGAAATNVQSGQGLAASMDEAEIRRIQQALKDGGHYDGEVDGTWGTQSESALRDFQQARGLEATGELNQEALAALGIDGAAADDQAAAGTEQPATQGGGATSQ
jgi:peptidoglycan hydrolase-like protein with peptidoglycan-binding domain